MLGRPMSEHETPSPLAVAALTFLDGPTAPAQVVERFATVEARVSEDRAITLLDELCRLGLARVVPGTGPHRARYRPTSLGQRLLSASFVGRGEHLGLLEEVEAMRTDLLSTIAHELRTPLTAVRTSVGLLIDPSVEPDQDQHRALLESIDRNAMRMQRVVGDILDLARFRAGRVQLQLRRFDAADVARSAIASVAPLAATVGQSITLDAPTELRVYGDYRRLEQALVNLLSNAQKYAPAGTRIDVIVAATDDEVSWAVRDRGPGIAESDRPRLFERFFVADRDRSEAAEGIGLGLPIALLIAQAHEGRIDVDSRLGSGSTFTIVVPLDGPTEGPEE